MDYEKRHFACEVRAEGDDAPKIIGYGSVFNSRSENLGGFREVIAPGAFDKVMDDDVRALFNHDRNIVLGRTVSKTLNLSVDQRGLGYEIIPPDTQTVRDLVMVPMTRGDISQSSFGFRVARGGEEWSEDDEGVIIRTITQLARLYDVSPVTYPAYPDTHVATRSLEAWQEARESGVLKKAVQQRQARERVLRLIGV